MRLATIRYQEKDCVAVMSAKGMIPLEAVGVHVTDMNELVRRYDELQETIKNGIDDAQVLAEGQYKLLAPIPVPLQDVICLGVNYREHIEETVVWTDIRLWDRVS